MNPNSCFSKIVSVVCATTLIYSTAGSAIHSAVSTAAGLAQQLMRGKPGPFVGKPTVPNKGPNPSRDETRNGWWTPKLRSDLRAVETRRALEKAIDSGDVFALADPEAMATVFQGGGGGSEGGGTLEGEGTLGLGGISGETNTNTGNKQTVIPIASWSSRGDINVGLNLIHNSKSNVDGEFGRGWTHNFEARIDYTAGSSAILTMPSGLRVPYTQNSNGTFSPPPGWAHQLVRNADGTFILTFKNQSKLYFSAAGFVSLVVDDHWNVISVNRNPSNKVTSIYGPDGRRFVLSYDTSGRVFSVLDGIDREWRFTYDSAGNMTSIQYPQLGSQTIYRNFTYDSLYNILTMTDLNGQVWTWTYDSAERVTSAKNPLNQTTSVSYTLAYTTITLPGGQTITDNYSSGLLTSRVDPAGYSVSMTYDTNRNVTSTTDQRGKVSQFTYDANRNVLTAKNPLNQTTTFTYNAQNQLTSVTDPLGNTTTYTWSWNNLDQVTDPLGRAEVRYTYDSYGQVLTEKDALNRTTTYAYNTNGDITSVTDPAGLTVTATYDGLGRPLTGTDQAGNTSSIGRDNWGRGVTVTKPGNAVTTVTYDNNGNKLTVTDPLSRVATWTYDAAGRLTTFTNPKGESQSYAYNSNGWNTAITNGRNLTRTFTRNVRGEVLTLTMPDSSVETWSYLGDGQLAAYTNPLGQVINYVYDDAGRLTGVDYPAGTDTTFAYDNGGRQTSMVDGTGTSSWTYNAADELTALATPQGNLTYAYNTAGEQTTMTEVGLGSTTYAYDSSGRATTMTNRFGEATTLTYNSVGQVSRRTFGSGQYEDYTYDNRQRPVTITLKDSSGTVINAQSYTYDAAGRISTHTDAGVTTTYGYDLAGQLASESRSGYSASYTYDGNGNRLTRTVNGVTEDYAYDNGDKLTSVSVGGSAIKTFGYDAAGRTTSVVTSSGTTSQTYDYESRLTAVTGPGITALYTYNGLDTRVGKTENGNTQVFKRDGVYVTDAVLSDSSAFYTPGVSEKRAGTTSYLHGGLKNQTRQTNSSQNVTSSRTYDAFGNVTSSSGTWNGPFGNAGAFGYQEDATGLKLLGHRYYDSSIGRFLTRDPIKDGRNWYAYCGNDPVNGADPSGLQAFDNVVIVMGEPNDSYDGVSDYLLYKRLKWWLIGRLNLVREIDFTDSVEVQVEALTWADSVYFIGHGMPGSGRFKKCPNGKDDFRWRDSRFDADWIKARRREWKISKLKEVVVCACSVAAVGQRNRDQQLQRFLAPWCDVTSSVSAYDEPVSFPLPAKAPTKYDLSRPKFQVRFPPFSGIW